MYSSTLIGMVDGNTYVTNCGELTFFDLVIDSKLRACDLVKIRVRDICHGDRFAPRVIVMQQKTSRPVQFEMTDLTRTAALDWIKAKNFRSEGISLRRHRRSRWTQFASRVPITLLGG